MEYFLADSVTPEVSYANWTSLWWKWALSIPKDMHPLSDTTGKNAGFRQPKSVWFLGGIWADEVQPDELPLRYCTIPKNASILIPILNCEADVLEYPEIKSDRDILDHVSNQVNKIAKKECYLNGDYVPPLRVRSEPLIFEIDIHPSFDKHKGLGGKVRASSDGYWVFLKPLPEGKHEIQFEGWYEHGKLKSGATYKIDVI